MRTRPLNGWTLALVAAAVVVLAAFSTTAITSTGFQGPAWFGPAQAQCDVPRQPGTVVDIALGDAGHQMMGAWPMLATVRASPQSVPAGTVSLVVRNRGQLVHELTVLPVAEAGVGTRDTGPDGAVAEEGSLGHAETACGTGEGDGIPPGGTSWLTLELAPGLYELICNEPWHYAAGMYEILTVT